MARTLSKQRFLPSLLDRLTDDDPINSSIKLQQNKISQIETKLAELVNSKADLAEKEYTKKRIALENKLDQSHAKYNVYSASISSLTEIRACVKRDLNWLLNASQYEPHLELESYDEIQHSVLNYGIADLTGKTVSGVDLRNLEQTLKQVIINFEPRIISKTLSIKVLVDKSMLDHNAVTFEIEGQLWAEPQPLHLHLRTEFELESGNVSVYDFHQGVH